MKKISAIILAMVMVMTLSQCKKNEPNTTADKGVAITLNVIDDDNSNSRVEVNTTTGTVDFENNDQILVASGGKYVGTLTYNGNLFTGSVYNAVAGYPLRFYFLGNITPAETLTYGETETCSVVITDQTEHLPVVSYAPSVENYGTTTDFTSHLLNKCALVKFNVTSGSEAATCITGFNNKVTVDFSESTLTPSQEGNGVITLPAGTGERWAILLPQAALAAGGAGSAYSADNAYTGTRGAVPAIGYNAFLTAGIPVMLEAGGSGGGGGGGGSIGGHDYVNLGLPSGLLWATCNVGANTSEGYGNYYAWGETYPKDNYDMSTYQHCNGSATTLTKYCSKSNFGYNGFTDNLTILLPEDDAATAIYGNGWRMPTKEEWQELYNNTTHTWMTQNGVKGQLFTASNGTSLFLPASGYRYYGGLYDVDSNGQYWSSSLNTDNPVGAEFFFFNSISGSTSSGNRSFGLSVRAVYSEQPSITSYSVTVTSNPAEGGNVSGGGTFQQGQSCTVSATANSGYTFTNWMESGSVVSTDASYTFTVNANRDLVANFSVISQVPTGAINGKFTINANGDQVYFSKGNLQYIGSAATPYWKFADNQWDYFGTTTGQNSSDQNVDRDLFGWGTSGYDHGAVCYQPWSTNMNGEYYYAYGYWNNNLYDGNGTADWGYNAIANGGNAENNGWRTLTNQEFVYVFNTRNTISGIRYAKSNVNGVNGVILLPDDWNLNYYTLNNTNSTGSNYSSNMINASQWSYLEQHGVVFLPAAGRRYPEISVDYVGSYGFYWSSSHYYNSQMFIASHFVRFDDNNLVTNYNTNRDAGFSVRLVRNAQ